jgi:hypothetical protein
MSVSAQPTDTATRLAVAGRREKSVLGGDVVVFITTPNTRYPRMFRPT